MEELQKKLPMVLKKTSPVKKEFVMEGFNVTIFVQFFMN
jgi:hypothetical protein